MYATFPGTVEEDCKEADPGSPTFIIITQKTTTTILWPFVWDYLGEPAPEETFTHTPVLIISHFLSVSSIYYDP